MTYIRTALALLVLVLLLGGVAKISAQDDELFVSYVVDWQGVRSLRVVSLDGTSLRAWASYGSFHWFYDFEVAPDNTWAVASRYDEDSEKYIGVMRNIRTLEWGTELEVEHWMFNFQWLDTETYAFETVWGNEIFTYNYVEDTLTRIVESNVRTFTADPDTRTLYYVYVSPEGKALVQIDETGAELGRYPFELDVDSFEAVTQMRYSDGFVYFLSAYNTFGDSGEFEDEYNRLYRTNVSELDSEEVVELELVFDFEEYDREFDVEGDYVAFGRDFRDVYLYNIRTQELDLVAGGDGWPRRSIQLLDW